MSLAAEDIRNEKVKVLRSMRAVALDDTVLGQYRSRAHSGRTLPGYLDDKTVPPVGKPGRRRLFGGGCEHVALPLTSLRPTTGCCTVTVDRVARCPPDMTQLHWV